jgi:hypothetical protein
LPSKNAKLRQQVIDRDGPGCAWCGSEEKPTLDHIDAANPVDDLENLQILCSTCNSRKSNHGPGVVDKNVRFASAIEQAGFTIVHNAILRDATLTPEARLLYSLLRSYAWQTDECFPGQAALATMIGCSERTVRTYSKELADRRMIRIIQRGRGRTNLYVILPVTGVPQPSRDRKPASGQGSTDRKPASDPDRKPASDPIKGTRKTQIKEDSVEPLSPNAFNAANAIKAALPEGIKYPQSWVGRVGKEAKKLLDEGIAYGDVVGAIGICHEKGLSPSLLPSLVLQFRARKNGHPAGSKSHLRVVGDVNAQWEGR